MNPSILKDDFSSRTDPYIFTLIEPVLLNRSNKTSWVSPALKPRSHFLPQSTVSYRSDSSSEANSSCCHRSDGWSDLAKSSIIFIDSSVTDNIIKKVINVKWEGRRAKNEALRNSSINWIFCEDFPSKTTRNHLLLRQEQLRPNIWLEIPHDLSLWRRPACQTYPKSLGYIKCYSSSSPTTVKSRSNSIRYECKKICSWSIGPKTILEIRKKATFL